MLSLLQTLLRNNIVIKLRDKMYRKIVIKCLQFAGHCYARLSRYWILRIDTKTLYFSNRSI